MYYIIVGKSSSGNNVYYCFSSDETDLYCNTTCIENATIYSQAEKERLEKTKKDFLRIRDVFFKRITISLIP